jgi:hypothetical protein
LQAEKITSATILTQELSIDRALLANVNMEANSIGGDRPPGQAPEEKKWSDEQMALIHAAMMVETKPQSLSNIVYANSRNRRSLELAARTPCLSTIKV